MLSLSQDEDEEDDDASLDLDEILTIQGDDQRVEYIKVSEWCQVNEDGDDDNSNNNFFNKWIYVAP